MGQLNVVLSVKFHNNDTAYISTLKYVYLANLYIKYLFRLF